jgi:hypothetical protein
MGQSTAHYGATAFCPAVALLVNAAETAERNFALLQSLGCNLGARIAARLYMIYETDGTAAGRGS